MNQDASMKGQAALVTGGGGGIGSAICRRLAAAGARVIITYRQSEGKAQAVAESLSGKGHLVAQASVTDSVAVAALATQVADRYGRLK